MQALIKLKPFKKCIILNGFSMPFCRTIYNSLDPGIFITKGVKQMEQDSKSIQIPKQMQLEMLKFFLKTSVPKKVKENSEPLSKKNDRSDK